MSIQNRDGHRQPPIKGLGKNLTQGAGQVDPVADQAPPNRNALQSCRVVLERINISCLRPQNNIVYHRSQLRPCTVNLQDCLLRDQHLQRKLKVQHCGFSRCNTCPVLDLQTKFHSNLTQKEYKTFSPDVISPLSCKSKNVIYLLSCQECGYQYIGETGRPLHLRMNGHRTTVRKKEGIRGRHFSKEGHNFRIHIIERLVPIQGESEHDLRLRREERELFWQKEK